MASRFDLKYNNFLKSLNGLEEVILKKEKLSKVEQKSVLYDFGGCEEQSWKLFKYYLEYIEGIECLGNASKKIYRTAKDLGIINEEECAGLLGTIDLRNNLFREYNYDSIDENCNKIKNYLRIFQRINEIFIEIRSNYKREFEKDDINT